MIAEPGKVVTDKWGNVFLPLSVKGIVEEKGKIWLRRNEWKKWELPGGRVDGEEQPEETVSRELFEELGLRVQAERVVDFYIWRKDFGDNPAIGILTFYCSLQSRIGELEQEGEAGQASFGQFSVEEALSLTDLPDVYKRALRRTYENHRP